MISPHVVFPAAFATLMLHTGEVRVDDEINAENLDRALRAYIRQVVTDMQGEQA